MYSYCQPLLKSREFAQRLGRKVVRYCIELIRTTTSDDEKKAALYFLTALYCQVPTLALQAGDDSEKFLDFMTNAVSATVDSIDITTSWAALKCITISGGVKSADSRKAITAFATRLTSIIKEHPDSNEVSRLPAVSYEPMDDHSQTVISKLEFLVASCFEATMTSSSAQTSIKFLENLITICPKSPHVLHVFNQ